MQYIIYFGLKTNTRDGKTNTKEHGRKKDRNNEITPWIMALRWATVTGHHDLPPVICAALPTWQQS